MNLYFVCIILNNSQNGRGGELSFFYIYMNYYIFPTFYVFLIHLSRSVFFLIVVIYIM